MYESLETKLDSWVSPERKGVIMDAMRVMEGYQFLQCWDEMSSYLEYATDEPLAMILDSIESMISVGLSSIINEHGIVSHGDNHQKTHLLEGLLILMNFEDSDNVRTIAGDGADPQHKLAELLQLATTRSWAYFIEFLDVVTPSLITRIAELHTPRGDDDGVDGIRPVDAVRKEIIKKFFAAYPDTLAQKAVIGNSVIPGTEFGLLMQKWKLPLALLEPRAPDAVAREVVCIALISDAPLDKLDRVVKDELDLVYTDINFLTKVDAILDPILAEVAKYGQA